MPGSLGGNDAARGGTAAAGGAGGVARRMPAGGAAWIGGCVARGSYTRSSSPTATLTEIGRSEGSGSRQRSIHASKPAGRLIPRRFASVDGAAWVDASGTRAKIAAALRPCQYASPTSIS
ncbi:MAG: hypothetical protein U0325_23735 [Polyangiales bacterium]